MIYTLLFYKCQDKFQIIKATTEHLKLSTNKHLNLFIIFFHWSCNAAGSNNKKIVTKKTRAHTIALMHSSSRFIK